MALTPEIVKLDIHRTNGVGLKGWEKTQADL
jgi:hypothetical protein